MTKQASIRKFCLECVGGSFKDVALCTAPSCVLWPWRLGCGPRSSKAKGIMARVRVNYPKDVADLGTYGLDPSVFFPSDASYKPKQRVGTILKGRVGRGDGEGKETSKKELK